MADVSSMTGYSDASLTADFGTLTVELRAVNGRFLELSLRLPEELRSAEAALRERIGALVARGKLDCRVSLSRDPLAGAGRINATVLAQLTDLWRQVHAGLPQATPLSTADVLRWPGIIETSASAARRPCSAAWPGVGRRGPGATDR